jgi:RNA polymerase sigma factor (sigma-70 family)
MAVRIPFLNPLAALDDRALLARFADAGDQPAFEQLVKRHGGLVFGVCRRAVRDRHLAEDAFQAVFLVLAREPRRAAGAASVGGWLFGVARRVGLAARRHQLRRAKRELLAHPNRAAEPVPPGDFDDLLRVLEEELAALPEEPRAALVACFLEERTHDEAARELGWSLSTLRRRLERGKELLRARLARRGVALAAGLLTATLVAPARAAVPQLTPNPSPTSAALAAQVPFGGTGAALAALVSGAALVAGALAFAPIPGGIESPADPTPVRIAGSGPNPTIAAGPRPIESRRWVTVSGRIVFPSTRELPVPRPVPADLIKDEGVWKPFGPLAYESVRVHPENRGLADVVVFLRPDSDDRRAPFPADKIHPALVNPHPVERTVRAAGARFAPRVLAARVGDRVTFDNELPVPTNVSYTASGGDNFNVLLGKGMAHTTPPLHPAHAPDRYQSSIYPWMTGCVWAFDHPYFAVTDADGRFDMARAPVGPWRLVVWHETAGYLGGALGTRVTVPQTQTGKVELAPLTFESDDW